MVVLRSFALIFIVYALVAMEATVSHYYKVGGNKKEIRKEEQK